MEEVTGELNLQLQKDNLQNTKENNKKCTQQAKTK